MKTYEVVGKTSFTSKKTGKLCRLVYTIIDDDNKADNLTGRATKEMFFNQNDYDKIEVGDTLKVYFNERGYIEEVNVIE